MSGSAKQEQQGTTSSNTTPWAPQASALETGFNAAGPALAKSQQATAPTDFTAGFTPDQLATFQQMLGYSANSNIPQGSADAASTLTNAGTGALTNSLQGLGNFNPQDATAQNIADATKYADQQGQYIPGMVQAAMRDANQNANDVTIPGMESRAAITGNTNSSRTGVAEGIVGRGLAQQAGDISANLRGTAFNEGLNRAQQGNQFNTTAMLQALTQGANSGNAAVNTGVNAGSTSINDQGQLFNLANTAGAGEQAANQADLTNRAQQYQSQTQSPFDALQAYMATIGGTNWGGSTTGTTQGTTTSTPSAWQVAGGLMGGAGSLMKGYGAMA